MVTNRRILGGLCLGGALVLTACAGGADAGTPGAAPADLQVVATTTMLGDVTQRVVRCVNPDAAVTTLMPPGADPHEFAASSKDATEVVKADLVVANGLGLEGGLGDVLDNARADGATVLEVAPAVDPIPFAEPGGHDEHADHADHEDGADEHEDDEHEDDEHEAEGHEDHDHGSEDPHFWFDVARMAEGARVIGDKLAEVSGDDAFATCGGTVHDELMGTDEQVREILAAVPHEKRQIVTDHDAFGYFAQAYDFEVLGTVIPGGSTEAEPSAQDIAELVHTIQDAGVTAIFSNTAVRAPVIDAVSREAGTDVRVVPLAVGALGEPDSPTGTYEGMMVDNAHKIADALG